MLVIVADDYGYAAAYDEGILAAARAQAIDAVGAMVLRDLDAGALAAACADSEVEIGLHLEPEASPEEQIAAFERLFGHPPAHLDGHHHCHADGTATARAVAALAVELAVAVRSIDAEHRGLLRAAGVATAERLVGRLAEDEPVVPPEIEALLAGVQLNGTTEWMVHPGHAGGPSRYDAGRERDLEELLRLGDRASWGRRGVLRLPPSRGLRRLDRGGDLL